LYLEKQAFSIEEISRQYTIQYSGACFSTLGTKFKKMNIEKPPFNL
jgi:hypothetical protein